MARFVPRPPTRRNALRAAALPLGLALPAAPARAADATRARHDASGLATPGVPWLTGVRLRYGTVLQSFAFDESHRCLYALQVVGGGVRLPGEQRAYTHAERVSRGDLCLNRLTFRGVLTGFMVLKGFGHGGAMGVEQHRKGSRLWTEWSAHPVSGYGRGVCWFTFADGRVLGRTSARLTVHTPVPGSTSNSVTLDQSRRRLLLRYKTGGDPRFAVYDLDRFAAGRFKPLADFAQPGADLGLPFQGMTLHGDTLYQLMGSGYSPGNFPEFGGDTYLGRTDWRTRTSHRVFPEQTAAHLSPREPEGLAVRLGDRRLYFGLTHGAPGAMRFSLYSKGLR
ncbi:teichoic acid biosynthesis protein C [Streptomyces sp. NPDC049813]|uniref:phage baseplate protein n=1 Tax=Streptomyces sp. NPDC049813 TaxID=3365597 RepID=UPI0037AB23F3